MMKNIFMIMACATVMLACGCGAGKENTTQTSANMAPIAVPVFNADSAYEYISRQVEFGPRVPGTKAHALCGDYLASQLEHLGAKVINQRGEVRLYDGKIVPARNVIGQFKPDVQRRVLLFAHWDTRPFADEEKDYSKMNTPILGANDGASGVGVLLEIARHLSDTALKLGVDIIFFDVEDWGVPDFYQGQAGEDTWCLGTQYWTSNLHVKPYSPQYGILLDMVGAPNATFFKEQISMHYASDVVEKVWSTARDLGYAHLFINEKGGVLTDDHLYVNRLAGIPSIDIIDFSPYRKTGFGAYWHTLDDTMANIDKGTLMAVGQTVLTVLYNE